MLRRVVAGMAAAALTGIAFDIVMTISTFVSERDPDLLIGLAWRAPFDTIFALVIGGVPAIAVMMLSRARFNPWYSLRVVVPAAAAGLLASTLIFRNDAALAGMIALATAAAVAATFALPKQPHTKS